MAYKFDRELVERFFGVREGDEIQITRLEDTYNSTYVGRKGVVEHIDSMGQLHGTWGGLAVIPGEDKFVIVRKKGEQGYGTE